MENSTSLAARLGLDPGPSGAPVGAPTAAPTLPPPEPRSNFFGLALIIIPVVTILGNLLVIVSVLRFKALHSAINFLILGLAVADLLVALFVMPYAVYVHVQDGDWFLGNLMCDMYIASDVACSTASILLLAVISFDRYRAVSRPIQYSRQSQNIKRVMVILAGIWLISLALASPIVFGVNARPAGANPYECRLYDAEFTIGSSMISFIIPCFLVLFVYIRIMLALKKRARAARERREKQMTCNSTGSEKKQDSSMEECEEAGGIVAGPEENEFCGSTPRSSVDSLSDNVNVVTNDFISEGATQLSRSSNDSGTAKSEKPKGGKKLKVLMRKSTRRKTQYELGLPQERNNRSNSLVPFSSSRDTILPAIMRQLSRRSPKLFRRRADVSPGGTETEKADYAASLPMHDSGTFSSIKEDGPKLSVVDEQREPLVSISERAPLAKACSFSRSTTANSADLIGAQLDAKRSVHERVEEEEGREDTPTVTFSLTVRDLTASPSAPEGRLKMGSFDAGQMGAPLVATGGQAEDKEQKEKTKTERTTSATGSSGSTGTKGPDSGSQAQSRQNSVKSCESRQMSVKRGGKGVGLATRIVKRTIKHEQSLKRKVSKSQRKEKRATKTLGIVVGIFLICWVPFFSLNIINGLCIVFDRPACQVGFDAFFYTTWLGYMNSFVNPIIYTIFNTEFRRAFKSLIFGKNAVRRSHSKPI